MPGAAPAPVSREVARVTPDAATAAANVALARRFRDAIFAAGDLDVADEILAPDVVWHAADVPLGGDGIKTFAGKIRAAFPDLTLTADQVVAASDRVAILWTLRGTHQGEFLGAAATGNSISTQGIDIYRIADAGSPTSGQSVMTSGCSSSLAACRCSLARR